MGLFEHPAEGIAEDIGGRYQNSNAFLRKVIIIVSDISNSIMISIELIFTLLGVSTILQTCAKITFASMYLSSMTIKGK